MEKYMITTMKPIIIPSKKFKALHNSLHKNNIKHYDDNAGWYLVYGTEYPCDFFIQLYNKDNTVKATIYNADTLSANRLTD